MTARFYIFAMLLFFALISCHARTESVGLITTVEAQFDVKQNQSLIDSVHNYLSRFIAKEAISDNRLVAEDFLRTLYSVSSVHCYFQNVENGFKLKCDIKSKRTIRNITVNNLPSSLLESELKRRLPTEIGQTIEIDESIKELLAVVKARVETFLKKNGYYDAKVTVTSNSPTDAPWADINIDIENGMFVRVNRVIVSGDSPIQASSIKKLFKRMCFSFNRIIESVSMGTLSCYSRELEREATQALQDRLAKIGYVQSQIRITHYWIDPDDKLAPKMCRSASKSVEFRCIDLRIHIEKGPKVSWTVNVKDRLAISRNAFLRFIGSIFAVDQFSRIATSSHSDEVAFDHMIIEEELLGKVTFVSSKNVDEQELSESAQEITEFLIARGYPQAEVVPSLVQEDDENISVQFDVYAGKPFFIESVKLMPDKYLPFIDSENLRSLVSIRSFAENGNLSYQAIESAKDEISDRLKSRGFGNVRIKADMESSSNGGVNVIFNVMSDQRETLDEIVILNGYGDLNEGLLPMLHNCDNYSPPRRSVRQRKLCFESSLVRDKINEDSMKITDYYQTNGFLYAKVTSEIVSNNSGNQLLFTIYDSRFGEKAVVLLARQVIKDIVISGNSRTSGGAIKRLFPKDRKSTVLDPKALKKGLANLRETGRFSRIDHKILAGQENSDDVYFLLQLAERPSLSLDTSIAFSTDQFFSLEAELEEANLFSSMLKLNTTLGLGLFWGRQSLFNNKFYWPAILGKPLYLTVNAPIIVYDHLLHRPNPSRRLQSKVSWGLDWRVTNRFMPYLKYWLVLTQEQSFASTNIPSPNFSQMVTSLDGLIPTMRMPGDIQGFLQPGISYINLDNPFDPRLGIDINLWTQFSGGPFLGSPPFVMVGTQNRFFIPMGPLTLALQATFMRAFIEPNDANWKKLRNGGLIDNLGGDRSIRGYTEGRIGIFDIKEPTNDYAGYFYNIANVELRFPITTKGSIGNFSGALFVDQGMLIPCSSLLRCLDAKSTSTIVANYGLGLSVGAALRYSLPVGPISLDYGISPLTGDNRVHILFGYAF